jgi:hypothetical protein
MANETNVPIPSKADWPFGVQPKVNSPARSLIAINKMNGWPDPTKIYDTRNGTSESIALWDHARTANNDPGLGNIPSNDPPPVNSGSESVRARDPRIPGYAEGSQTEGPVYQERETFNYPGRDATRGGAALEGGLGWMSAEPTWNAPQVTYQIPAIGARGRRSSNSTPTGGA